jgi:predicted CXXCH cytochrome family protein
MLAMSVEAKHVVRSVPLILIVGAVVWWLAARSMDAPNAVISDVDLGSPDQKRYSGSTSCSQCHRKIYDDWAASHHGLAEVPFDPKTHGAAFEPQRDIRHGDRKSIARVHAGKHELVTEGPGEKVQSFRPARIIGIEPLWQPVVAAAGGRYQVTALSFDPKKNEWFDVYGEENRRPHEWGHWSNRGMTWNSMCATCHTTDYRKRYDVSTDTYDSKYVELGVGCESCHGPYADHIAEMKAAGKSGEVDASGNVTISWPPKAFLDALEADKQAPGEQPRGRLDAVMDTCGACHARRSELTGRVVPGARFVDHFRPVLPDDTEVYYADGQVHEEDYEYTSFLSSRMYRMGVRCVHCHEPHTAKVRAPGNKLCLGCHEKKVDPVAHSHHAADSAGAQCTGCHMPLTTFMQRHPRRDHGFTIPDPTLTRDHGIPNACSRCHSDKTTDWAIEWTQTWYGERMNRHTQKRARIIAGARDGNPDSVDGLVDLLAEGRHEDQSPMWRSVAAGLLAPWAPARADVRQALFDALSSPDHLLRGVSARVAEILIGPQGDPRFAARALEKLTALLEDPVRLVRVEAAWTLRRQLDMSTKAGKELDHYLTINSDQPTGALQRGVFHFDRIQLAPGNLDLAIHWMEKAVGWDPYSAALHDHAAIVYDRARLTDQAIASLEKACDLAPDQPHFAMRLGLALAAADRLEDAEKAIETACTIDDSFGRAWYNLALLRNDMGKSDEALATLDRAIDVEPRNGHYLYTRATVLHGLERYPAALEAVLRAEALGPPSPTLIELRGLLHQALGNANEALRASAELERATRGASGGR